MNPQETPKTRPVSELLRNGRLSGPIVTLLALLVVLFATSALVAQKTLKTAPNTTVTRKTPVVQSAPVARFYKPGKDATPGTAYKTAAEATLSCFTGQPNTGQSAHRIGIYRPNGEPSRVYCIVEAGTRVIEQDSMARCPSAYYWFQYRIDGLAPGSTAAPQNVADTCWDPKTNAPAVMKQSSGPSIPAVPQCSPNWTLVVRPGKDLCRIEEKNVSVYIPGTCTSANCTMESPSTPAKEAELSLFCPTGTEMKQQGTTGVYCVKSE